MKKIKFRTRYVYIVLTHYNEDGNKSRIVKKVLAKVFMYRGYEFAVYYDYAKRGLNDNSAKWKVIDVATGKAVVDGRSKELALMHLIHTSVFNDYLDLVGSKDYEALKKELQDLLGGIAND